MKFFIIQENYSCVLVHKCIADTADAALADYARCNADIIESVSARDYTTREVHEHIYNVLADTSPDDANAIALFESYIKLIG